MFAGRILITGAQGFIGRNLSVKLCEMPQFSVEKFTRSDPPERLHEMVARADAIVHLAGENRPREEKAFIGTNVGLTKRLCDCIRDNLARSGRHVPIIFASSIQAEQDNPYGRSKRDAENILHALQSETGNPILIFRFPGVFGKWCQPNYNSVVATFCHNIARNLPIRIDNPGAPLRLVYVDDVVDTIVGALRAKIENASYGRVEPEYEMTVGDLACAIRTFAKGRGRLEVAEVGDGILRALYATYVSSLPIDQFSYPIKENRDERGVFVEMIKTRNSGQVSFLTAPPGVTRGGHYHHTKTEKFLVVRGVASFRYRHLLTDERVEVITSGSTMQIVETIPGWVHDITNIGKEEMIVMLWANEVFDPMRADTIAGDLP